MDIKVRWFRLSSVMRAIPVVVALFTGQLFAEPILNVDMATGTLLGASNVEVDGRFYDVAFVDGSFVEVFVDASGFDAVTHADAVEFSLALATSVMVDRTGPYDIRPDLIAGCSILEACIIGTPYKFNGDDVIEFNYFLNGSNESIDNIAGSALIRKDFDISADGIQTWADWSLSSVPTIPDTTIPEPTSFAILALGLFGIGLSRYKVLAS